VGLAQAVGRRPWRKQRARLSSLPEGRLSAGSRQEVQEEQRARLGSLPEGRLSASSRQKVQEEAEGLARLPLPSHVSICQHQTLAPHLQ
jgi:hypothetical protein